MAKHMFFRVTGLQNVQASPCPSASTGSACTVWVLGQHYSWFHQRRRRWRRSRKHLSTTGCHDHHHHHGCHSHHHGVQYRYPVILGFVVLLHIYFKQITVLLMKLLNINRTQFSFVCIAILAFVCLVPFVYSHVSPQVCGI